MALSAPSQYKFPTTRRRRGRPFCPRQGSGAPERGGRFRPLPPDPDGLAPGS